MSKETTVTRLEPLHPSDLIDHYKLCGLTHMKAALGINLLLDFYL